jgi:hypothetical protein
VGAARVGVGAAVEVDVGAGATVRVGTGKIVGTVGTGGTVNVGEAQAVNKNARQTRMGSFDIGPPSSAILNPQGDPVNLRASCHFNPVVLE